LIPFRFNEREFGGKIIRVVNPPEKPHKIPRRLETKQVARKGRIFRSGLFGIQLTLTDSQIYKRTSDLVRAAKPATDHPAPEYLLPLESIAYGPSDAPTGRPS